jgi:hypothetical protein
LIDPPEAFQKTTSKRRILKKLRSHSAKIEKRTEKESNKSCFIRIGCVKCSIVPVFREKRPRSLFEWIHLSVFNFFQEEIEVLVQKVIFFQVFLVVLSFL